MQFIKNKTSKKSKLLVTSSLFMLNGNMCTQLTKPRFDQNLKKYAAKIQTIDTSKNKSMGIHQAGNEAKGSHKALKYYLQKLEESLPKDNGSSNKHLKDSIDTLKHYLQKVESGLLKGDKSSKKDIQELYNTLKDCLKKVAKNLSEDNLSSREDLTALYNTIIDRLQKEKKTFSIDNDEGYGSDTEAENEGYEIGYTVKPIYESTNYGMINSTKNQKQAYSHATKEHDDQGYHNSGGNMANHIYANLKDDGQQFGYDDDTGEHIYESIDNRREDNASLNTSNIVNNRVCETICEQEEDDEALDTDNIYESIDESSTNNKEATKLINVMKGLKTYLETIGNNALNMQHLTLITKTNKWIEKAKEIQQVINEIIELRKKFDSPLTDKQIDELRRLKVLINGPTFPFFQLIHLYSEIDKYETSAYSKKEELYKKELDKLLNEVKALRNSIKITQL
ncbi:hypothetical protein [Cardinium endosymbiont of Philonthus spinipes]|uniref:hypothetical protein n=1 Tax=Cardinium endosymbiont of Philonthus spinipes TaxID=3077941 RepID=UPI00313EADEB